MGVNGDQPELSRGERTLVLQALRFPRGRYGAERAAQLSGVPARTLYEWSTKKVLVPDFVRASPRQWSYRDLVFARLLAWLRSSGMERPEATKRVASIRVQITKLSDEKVPLLKTDGRELLWDGEDFDRVSGQQVANVLGGFAREFDILTPVEDLGGGRLWGPNLVRPSKRTAISPWVLGGEPCVRDTRIPTSTILALSAERALPPSKIVRLYPGLDEEDVRDAVGLETRLRSAA